MLQFIMSSLPENVPVSLRCGDTWRWTRTLADYPAGTWTLKYRFKSASGGFEVVASADGVSHAVSVASSTTAGKSVGGYTWIAWVESGTEKFTVDEGSTELLPDYRTGEESVALDDRSHARKMLDAIEAWLESRDPAVAEYEIAGRRMKYVPISELMRLRLRYQNEVKNEESARRLARGEGFGRKIQFRM